MDLSKKRIKTFLIFILSFLSLSLSAQTWELDIEYLPKEKSLKVSVFGADNVNSNQEIYFNESILRQNSKTNLTLYNKENNDSTLFKAPFSINFKENYFTYKVDLKNISNVPTSAVVSYGEIELWNLNEILFSLQGDENPDFEIHFKKEKGSRIQTKKLSEWKADPIIMRPQKLFVEVQNVRFYSTLKGEQLQELITQTFINFNYLKEESPKEVFLIFDSKGLQSGGASFEDIALVYFDAQTSQEKGLDFIQAVILHELFHFVLPYKIVAPENETSIMNWVSEAAPEYFTYRYLLKHEFISDKDFLEVMEVKLRQALPYDSKSLVDLSKGIYTNPDYYQAFYSKGVIALWLMEMKQRELKDYNYSFQELINRNTEKQKATLALEKEITDFSFGLSNNTSNFALNKLLVNFGLLYEKKIILPLEKNEKEATILLENINYNKMATSEQKEHWQRFVRD